MPGIPPPLSSTGLTVVFPSSPGLLLLPASGVVPDEEEPQAVPTPRPRPRKASTPKETRTSAMRVSGGGINQRPIVGLFYQG
jgi:hypothetical protein